MTDRFADDGPRQAQVSTATCSERFGAPTSPSVFVRSAVVSTVGFAESGRRA